MDRTISILAAPPGASGGDAVLDDIEARIKRANERGLADHTVMHTWSVQHLAYLLEHDKESGRAPPSRIQIIGHGSSGMLSLGYHWTKRYKQIKRDGSRHYVLDSDPNVYNALRDRVGAKTEVWLIGCSVGDDTARTVNSWALGPTLLFDLSQMWGCPVAAPATLVTAQDFNSSGFYDHQQRMMRIEGLKITPPAERSAAPTPSNVLPEPLIFKRILNAPTLDFIRLGSPPRSATIDPELGSRLSTIFRHKARVEPQLAMAEMIFEIKIGTKPHLADWIDNGRLLRVRPKSNLHREANEFYLLASRELEQELGQCAVHISDCYLFAQRF